MEELLAEARLQGMDLLEPVQTLSQRIEPRLHLVSQPYLGRADDALDVREDDLAMEMGKYLKQIFHGCLVQDRSIIRVNALAFGASLA